MSDFRKTAKQYIDNGYYVIPVNKSKQPAVSNWAQFQTSPMSEKEVEKYFKSCYGIALLCGGKPRVFACDLDLKYSLNAQLMDEIKEQLPNHLLSKLYVQKTVNNGYHFIMKVPESKLAGNEKFASRYTTASERDVVYREAYKMPKHRDNALKMALAHRSMILLESRSGSPTHAGGYVLMPPTPGYEHVYGKINEVSDEEYDLLVSVLRSFNEVIPDEDKDKKSYDDTQWDLTPFEDYNERGCIFELLGGFGWEIDRDTVNSIRWKRPGSNHSSALYDKTTGVFNCFSTSTSLPVDRGLNISGLFIELECEGDASKAFRKLIELGYGVKK